MTIEDIYTYALLNNEQSLILVIEFLVYEKKVLTLEQYDDDLMYYLQEKFQVKMNKHLLEYKKQKGSAS